MNWREVLDAASKGIKGPNYTEMTADLIAFLGTVFCAAAFDWRATGLVWGLWLSSLTFGYTYIVIAIFRGALIEGDDGEKHGMTTRIVAGVPLLLFFSFHFGMFHFVHGAFLSQFFPFESSSSFGFPNPLSMFLGALGAYWPMVVATFVSRYKDLPVGDLSNGSKGMVMVGPYVNVVRMHLLIFIFAGLNGLGLSGLAIYPVLFFYFFPWKSFLKAAQEGKSAA